MDECGCMWLYQQLQSLHAADDGSISPVGFNYYAKGLSWDAVRGSLISTA